MTRSTWLLIGACALLAVLWLPGLEYPILSDTARYALLGESLWTQGAYVLGGQPYALHLPLHAAVSYPFVWVHGPHIGMKVSSLLAGFGVLISSYFLFRKLFSKKIALGVVGALVLYPPFVLMTTLGSADLLFTALLLLSLLMYVLAERNPQYYLATGVFLGLACLTRYNGAPFFLLFLLYTVWKRPVHLRSARFWVGGLIGAAIFGSWFLRNLLVFGDPLYSGYTTELGQHAPSLLAQFQSNILYYINPLHNILPILFIFALVGIYKKGRGQSFLTLAMLFAWVLTSIWWVQAIRFAFPGYVILIAFAVVGLALFFKRFPKLTVITIAAVIITHAGAMCLYTYGSCNAWFDRTIGGIPQNLGLSTEGFYTWDQARDFINANAEEGDKVLGQATWETGVFRKDLVVEMDSETCPLYKITREPQENEQVLFETEDHPVTAVVYSSCRSR